MRLVVAAQPQKRQGPHHRVRQPLVHRTERPASVVDWRPRVRLPHVRGQRVYDPVDYERRAVPAYGPSEHHVREELERDVHETGLWVRLPEREVVFWRQVVVGLPQGPAHRVPFVVAKCPLPGRPPFLRPVGRQEDEFWPLPAQLHVERRVSKLKGRLPPLLRGFVQPRVYPEDEGPLEAAPWHDVFVEPLFRRLE